MEHYVDDILVHTESWPEYLVVLQDLLPRIQQAGLTIRLSKCYIGYRVIDFVGHKVGDGDIRMEEDKTEKIRSAERPRTKKQVRSFIGLANYCRKFIPNFAEVAVHSTEKIDIFGGKNP